MIEWKLPDLPPATPLGSLVTPTERGEPRSFISLVEKVPNSAVIKNQWLTKHGSNFSGGLQTKKKIVGRVAALSDDTQKFKGPFEYQNPRNPASSGCEVRS